MATPIDLEIAASIPKTGLSKIRQAVSATLSPSSKEDKTYKWQEYVNRETGKQYKPKIHRGEDKVIYSDSPAHVLVKGGEGGGKSVGGIIKTLERLRRGMSGIMVSPDFEHFKKSLWAEFRRWCPTEAVIERERYRLRVDWEPSKQFELHFHNEFGGISTLYCGGMDDPTGWRGPNVSFAYGDEVSRKEDALMLKYLAGRVRIDGPNGEPPQLWFTTTPAKHWLYDYFGGVADPFGNLDEGEEPYKTDDKLAIFKEQAVVVTILTKDNEENLSKDYVRNRRSVLTEAEARQLMDALWEDPDDVSHFLESMTLWDSCYDEAIEPLGKHEACILSVDGAYSAKGDVFGAVASTLLPSNPEIVAIREVMAWEAKGVPRDFDQIEDDLKEFCLTHAVMRIVYDPRELHHMMSRLKKESFTIAGKRFPGVHTEEFQQGVPREVADKALKDRVVSRLLAHNGDKTLRKHVYNANKKTTDDGKRLRIVRRSESQKIDLCVCASMSAFTTGKIKPPVDPPRSYSQGLFR